MCLLTTSTLDDLKSVFLADNGVLESTFCANPDGLGVMYYHSGELHVQRVLPRSLDEARAFLKALPDGDGPVACHWRMRTHGHIDLENCHPYEVKPGVYLAHNGILHTGNDADPSKSDTWHFIRRYLAHLPVDVLHDPAFGEMLGGFIRNNRFAIMSEDGRLTVINRNQGVETHGVWFSNTYAWAPELLLGTKYAYAGVTERDVYPYRWMPDVLGAEDADYADFGVGEPEPVPTAVEYALDFDTDALVAMLQAAPRAVIEDLAASLDITAVPDADISHRDYAEAWEDGDVAYLAQHARRDPERVAEALVYFCDYKPAKHLV